jgi:hypothetical protein
MYRLDESAGEEAETVQAPILRDVRFTTERLYE